MTLASELHTYISALRECGRPGLAQDLAALSNRIATMERSYDEVITNAAEDADNAERTARLRVAPFRPRLRLVGAPDWCGPVDGVR